MALVSTGLDASGHPIFFQPDAYPYVIVAIQFVVSYQRNAGIGAYAPNTAGPVAPNFLPINVNVQYLAGDVTQVYQNEAAALVKAGVAVFF